MSCSSADTYCSVRLSAGSASYELSEDVEAFTIDDEATRPAQAELTVGDPFFVLSHAVREGMGVSVELGTLSEHTEAFRGRVYVVESELPNSGVPKLRLVAHDDRMRMGLRERNRRFTDTSLSEIVRKVAGAYFSDVDVDLKGDPDFGENGVRQAGQTDLEFLLALADDFECELLWDPAAETLRFVSSSTLRTQAPSATLYYQRAGVRHPLSSFRPRFDIGQVRLAAAQASIDGDSGEEVEVFVRELGESLQVRDALVDENLSHFARAHPERSAKIKALMGAADTAAHTLHREIGTQRFGMGLPFLKPGQRAARARNEVSRGMLGMSAEASVEGPLAVRTAHVVRIENAGGRFSGDWYVRKVRHLFDETGRRTELECER